jgi:hypothetical protein
MQMRLMFLGYIAFVGALAFLVLFVADREREAGVERLSTYRIPHPAFNTDPDLRMVSANSPYMRTER